MSTIEVAAGAGAVKSGAVATNATRPIWLWAALAAMAASLPSLLVGFASDDLIQRLMLEGRVPGYTGGWIGLYDFTPPSFSTPVQIREGYFPWFTHPGLSLRFLRPLSSATLALDHALFGRSAFFAHLHSVLWMAALAGVAGRLYQRWFNAPAALLASLVFALSGVHAMPISWLAARHTLVAATFGALSLWAWARYREDHLGAGRLLALLALAASLASSESGLVALALLVSYELCSRGLKRGLAGAALPLGLGVAYLALYAALGYGTRGSGFYISPFDAPLEYLTAAFWGVPALSAELLLGVPSIVAGVGGRATQALLAGVGVCALIAAAALSRALLPLFSTRSRRVLAGLSLGSLVSLFALVGAPVSGRVLPLPLLGVAALAGHALWGCWELARGRQRKRFWGALVLVMLFQLGVSPLVRLAMPLELMKSSKAQQQLAKSADVASCASGGSLYLVNGSDPMLTLYARAALAFYTPEKAGAERLWVLSMAPQTQRLSHPAPGVLELEVLDPPRRSHAFEGLFRAPSQPLQAGQRVQLGELSVKVDATSEGLFTRARFELARASDLERGRACLLVWKHGRLENLPVPALGRDLRIEHEPGPMGL